MSLKVPIATVSVIAVAIVSVSLWLSNVSNQGQVNAKSIDDFKQDSKDYATKDDVAKIDKSVQKLDEKFDKLNDYLLSNKR
jgi:hypothetical protein